MSRVEEKKLIEINRKHTRKIFENLYTIQSLNPSQRYQIEFVVGFAIQKKNHFFLS